MARNKSLLAAAASLALLVPLVTGCASAHGATRTRLADNTRGEGDPAGRATTELGLDLLPRLDSGRNVVFSPDSIAAALAMTGTGARGHTASQIAHVLHVSSPASFASLGELQQTIVSEQGADPALSSEAPTLSVANGLFLQSGYPLEQAFTGALQQAFAMQPQQVDFTAPSAVEAINDWAAQQTHGLIDRPVGELPAETRLALVNAIYLKVLWQSSFSQKETRPAAFHGPSGTSSAKFMYQTEAFLYGRGPGYAALSMPYRDSTLSLLALLPERQSLAALERQLNERAITRVIATMRMRNVSVSLPRLHLDAEELLNEVLERLGMTDAFSETSADFSAMTSAERLRVGQVIHAADFTVEERGTEAAAVTVVGIEPDAARVFRHVVAFTADRPFLFFLRDDRTGALLFAGRVVKPEE